MEQAKWKFCIICKRVKSVAEFYRKGPLHHSYCKACCRMRTMVLRADKAVAAKEGGGR